MSFKGALTFFFLSLFPTHWNLDEMTKQQFWALT